MTFQLDVPPQIQHRVLEEAQRKNIDPKRLFDTMMDTFLSENPIERHITVNERGVARITGHRIKVAHIGIENESNGLSPSEIASAYILSLAQVHAALAYYYDHHEEVETQIEASRLEAKRLQNEAGEPPFLKRLRAEGKTA